MVGAVDGANRIHANLSTLHVPQDYATIQAAIDAALNDDVIVVSPGTYNETPVIAGKRIILASTFYTTQERAVIDQTIIDGGGAATIVTIDNDASGTQLIGFTIQDGEDGINLRTQASILDNKIHLTMDGIDSTSGGGLIKGNLFENNTDDGVDFDNESSGTIENNIIRNNEDDGIEVRLHDYNGPRLDITIRGNTITGNQEDGIQLIDYPGLSDRLFTIERNLIQGNAQVGLGLMDQGDTKEDYRAASIPERIHLFNNTFVNNPYAITGGDNLIALNNIFVDASVMALKNIDGNSVTAYSLFWNNAEDVTGSNVVSPTVLADALLDASFTLGSGSPAIDVGTANYVHGGETVLNYPAGTYTGSAPDLGWREVVSTTNTAPTANPDSYTTNEDAVLHVAAPGVLGNDSDADVGDTLTAVLVGNASHGSLTLNATGSFGYTPTLNYTGPDSFSYQARDASGAESAPVTVTLTITFEQDHKMFVPAVCVP
jgi:parallel beta-helix repeat protein